MGLVFVVVQLRSVLRHDTGTDQMREIAAAIQEGAAAFLQREYTFLSAFVAVVTVVIAVFLDWQTAVAFVAGAVASGAAGYLGMYVAVRANVRTTAAAQRSLDEGLRVAFGSGSVMGMAVVSFSLLGPTGRCCPRLRRRLRPAPPRSRSGSPAGRRGGCGRG
jgi:K(+)-stimulated pyrophosphate-energized sodium pump